MDKILSPDPVLAEACLALQATLARFDAIVAKLSRRHPLHLHNRAGGFGVCCVSERTSLLNLEPESAV
ncbi:hypothetical protein BH10PSE7_BH10PSE7_15110 [soil metagenome]